MIKLRDYEKEHLLNILDDMADSGEDFAIVHGARERDLEYMTSELIKAIIRDACEEGRSNG